MYHVKQVVITLIDWNVLVDHSERVRYYSGQLVFEQCWNCHHFGTARHYNWFWIRQIRCVVSVDLKLQGYFQKHCINYVGIATVFSRNIIPQFCMLQNNFTKKQNYKLSLSIFGCNKMTVKLATHGHYQILGSLWHSARSSLLLLSVPASSALSLTFRKWSAYFVGVRSGDWLGHFIKSDYFASKKTWVAFPVCFGSLFICSMKRHMKEFLSIWLNLSRKYWTTHFRIHPATFIQRQNVRKYKGTCSIGGQTCP